MSASAIGASSDILAACQVLFGPEVDVSHEFLAILHLNGVRDAFRRRARETHPDLHAANPEVQQRQAHLFHEVTTAYRRVSRYCERRLGSEAQGAGCRPSAPSATAPEAKAAPRRQQRPGHYFQGDLPRRRMIIGRYLYYRGVIPYHALIESLNWQRRQRPAIGQLARQWGWLDDLEVVHILAATKCPGRFGERAREMGFLSAYQVKLLLRAQQLRQRRLGEFFVDGGYLSQRRFEQVLAEMQQHNLTISSR
jgi:hypothetical protein